METGDEGHSRARTPGNALGSNDSDSDSDSMLEFIDNEDEDEDFSEIRRALDGRLLEGLQQRLDLKIPFVVGEQDLGGIFCTQGSVAKPIVLKNFDLYRQRGFLGIDSSNFFENSSYLSRDMVISVMT